ncbi:DEAD DEAH box helicase Type III restriction enzyme res subunit Helicase conserved C terminal domain [Trypanosoma vivax]|uniref:Putative ATP-dependent RNA helicase n=1 Tax=Trypanosoma vivax (strain Y486) TaxID=1055687 RepID=G0TVJ1_TRYVY|nr:putative ATP-dependent RNA helicase [Trypanosoma vivax]KAH8620471.1 DEAD DEAH box helicase Type III restriction enzyme res subunit Helicase conserved C terminal domain [Trypanosoma vivax]CCC47957.1 putative ATP-dependent RNA helicase [Trypanosoma vivax Y486]
MATSSRYVPHTERTRVHYERFLRDLRRWLPPSVGDDIGEIAEETLSVVCRVGGGGDAGGSGDATASLHNVRKRLEVLFDTQLTAESLHEVLQYGRLINDFVVADEVADAHHSVAVANDGLDGLLLMQEDGGQRPEGTLSSDSEGDENVNAMHSSRRDLMKFAVDVEAIEDGYDDESNSDGEHKSKSGMKRISFEEVACNTNYVRDSLRRLFPTQTLEECELQAARVLQYASQRRVDQLTLETQLTAFLGGYDDEAVMDWIGIVSASRWEIVYGLRFASGQNQKEKSAVMDSMKEHARSDRVVERLYQNVTGKELDRKVSDGQAYDDNDGKPRPLRRVDLQAYAFKDERAPHQHARAVVPHGTQRAVFETHDEVVLPPTVSSEELPCTPMTAFPEWARPAFPGITQLNPMQSKTFECAFNSDENMLVSAPTGAGKTNVAMMTMLRAIRNATKRNGSIDLHKLKMVYVAPMKALVQEVVRTFSVRLEPLGLSVIELSGDSNANQAQLLGAQLIVTTPEKWDVVTRKSVELGVASLLKLIIIDEVHLLHNERGPVLEAIVARTILQQQLRDEGGIRIVGLSATLPNAADVASFLQVDRQRGLFIFDSSYRPIPLQQTFCAMKKVRGTNQAALMNLVVYGKVLDAAMEGSQSLVFVHSRKDTEYTAMYMMRRIVDDKRTHYFVRPGSESEQALHEAINNPSASLRSSIRQMLPMGFGVHHAGMSSEERNLVESLFSTGHVRVLVCTSTLAWGVNLPAHQVIVKGTRVFNGAKGETELLSALDVLQMFGRAGRLGFGSALGKAVMITTAEDLQYYLSALNNQLPIESQMVGRLVDMVNAEVVLGHIACIADGVRWLQRTYLYTRMRRAPEIYGTRASSSDPLLLHHLENVVHTAVDDLRRSQMVEYDTNSRRIAHTAYGRIASYYYLTAASMTTYLTHLTNTMHDVDLFRLFAMSKEFAHIAVRPEEQAQLQFLLENAPIAVRESRYTPLAKINVLLQCYISGMSLQGLPLMSELVYVKDSAERLLRALHEISLVREYGCAARRVLQLCLMTVHRQWAVQSPARQLKHTVAPKTFDSFIHALEGRRVSWEEVRAWSVEDLAEKLSDERRAEAAYACIRQVPHFILEATVRPLTRRMLYIDIDITPDFLYNEQVHGQSAGELLITVEHTNGRILHYERMYLQPEALRTGGTVSAPTIVVPAVEPKPTHYFVRCQSLNWLGAECSVGLCLMNVLLPDIAPPLLEAHQRPSTMEDEQERDVSASLQPYGLEGLAAKVFPFTEFFHTQHDLIVPIMEHKSENIFAALPPGGGKTVVAELFILQFLLDCALLSQAASTSSCTDGNPRINEVTDRASGCVATASGRKLLYLTAHEGPATRRFHDWRFKFGGELEQRISKLEPLGESLSVKVDKVNEATIIIASGKSLVPLLRHGATDCLAAVTHLIVDHVHLLRAPDGRLMEECVARLQSKPFIMNCRQKPPRILALSYPLISCAEVSRWMKIPVARQYNYGNSYRQLHVRLEAVEHLGAKSRYEAAVTSALKMLQSDRYASSPCVLFVPTARDAEVLAKRVLLRCRDFVPSEKCEGEVEDHLLALLLSGGVAYMHRGTSLLDELSILERVEKPVRHPETNVSLPLLLVCSFEAAWRLPAALFGTSFVCAAERVCNMSEEGGVGSSNTICATDCSVMELLQMASRALNEAVVYCRAARRWVWSRLLNEPLPLESHLRYPEDFCDTVNAAVAQGRAIDMPGVLRVLQSHYFLHHLRNNLHFYGVPSKEDIPAYASEFARLVINSLREMGCVSTTALGDGDDDELVSIHSTPRGVAAARHGICVESLKIMKKLAPDSSKCVSVAVVWQFIASSCVELTPEYVGDAARVVDVAELRALQTVARAFPAQYDVRYVDLDFSKGWTKVQLLILAHCARFFATSEEGGGRCEADLMEEACVMHPFASQSSMATDPHLLLQIPHTVAERLREDLHHLLPVVLEILLGACEVLESKTEWKKVHCLMRLVSQIERRVWGFEDALLQVPCIQETRALRQLLLSGDGSSCSHTLESLQQLGAEHCEASKIWEKFSSVLRQNGLTDAEGLVKRLHSEVAAIPRVVSLRAEGTVALLDGVYNFVVSVDGCIECNPPSSCNGEWLGSWWVACVLRHEGCPEVSERFVALRVVTPVEGRKGDDPSTNCDVGNPAAREAGYVPTTAHEFHHRLWHVNGALSFPLHDVEGEDLETLSMSVVLVSSRFRADAEVNVVFVSN